MNTRSETNLQKGATPDILLIDKPVGLTSFDVIRVLKKALGVKRIGHSGTLDPAASGLLVVGVGEGTKRLEALLKDADKTYEVGILLGVRTDTGDLDGTVVETANIPDIDETQIKNMIQTMCTTLTLPVPKYSAVKVGGKRLYEYARKGEDVDIPTRSMRVYDITLTNITPHEHGLLISVVMRVASGVYVRSVAEEVGRQLGTLAVVASLRRTQVGEYDVACAEPLSMYE